MKKVFLLFTSALAVVAAQAGGALTFTGDLVEGTCTQIAIPYNSYGTGDKTPGGSYQWQGSSGRSQDGCAVDVITDAVEKANADIADGYAPSLGEIFTLEMKVSANADLTKLQAVIVDEREVEANWWTQLSAMYTYEGVAKDEEITFKAVLPISTVKRIEKGIEYDLTEPNLVIAAEFANADAAQEFGTSNPVILTVTSCKFTFMEAGDWERPFILASLKEADGVYSYQGEEAGLVSSYKSITTGAYVNVSMEAVLDKADITNIQFALVCATPEEWFRVLTDDDKAFRTFATNKAKGETIMANFSLPILKEMNGDIEDEYKEKGIKVYFLAESATETSAIVIDLKKLDVDITAAPKYAELTAVEEVAADLAIEGGVVYSAGQITVYNVAGQVVATAAQELNINALEAGVYFISAPEGTAKIVK